MDSNTVQAIGSIVQAMAAIGTLGAMLYLGNRQNKIVDAQIVEKRERIYEDLIFSINKNIFCYPIKLLDETLTAEERNKEMISYVVDIESQLSHIIYIKERLSFIFNQNFINKVLPCIDKEIKLLRSFMKVKHEYNNYRAKKDTEQVVKLYINVGELEKATSDVLAEIKQLFNEELIFNGK